ncbi:MAG TPA: LPS export ABC transporter permease LptG [Caulobacterales bacterium]|nr:LPS export ABC transporter permease LptG [Caulobacterales bacterium]
MMGFLSSRVGRYLTSRTLAGVFIALAAVLISILLIDLVEQMRSVGQRIDLPIWEAARLTLFKTPMLIEQTLPFVVLAGTMIAIIGLNRSSELIALRAAGVSAWRFLTPPAFVGFVLGVLVITLLNPLGSWLYQNFESERTELLSDARQAPTPHGVWIRQGDENGQVVIHADGVDATGAKLHNASLMFFQVRDGTLRIERRMRAAEAELRPGFWQLTDIVEATPGATPQREAHLAIPTNLDASELLDRFVAPAGLSFWALPGFINEAKRAGFAPTRYELKWQGLLAYPFMLAAMAGLGAVFSLRLQRLGNLAQWGATGVGLGLFLFFYSQMAGAFAITQAVPAVVAAWAAPLAGVFVALAMVAFLEDG